MFGATHHAWAHSPVPDAEIAAFEAAHGVTLPAAYRTWLGLHDKLWMALAALELRAGHVPEAEAAIERAVGLSGEPDGTRAVGRCLVAAGDAPVLLAAADAGLGAHNLGFLTELRLLRFRKDALERLERWSDAAAVVQTIADHCKWTSKPNASSC